MNLTITRLKKSDFGEYSCSAVNGYGKAEGIITLKGEQYQATPYKTYHKSKAPLSNSQHRLSF